MLKNIFPFQHSKQITTLMKEEPCLDAVQHDELAPGDHQPGPGHDRGVQAVHHPLPPGHLLRHPPGLLPGHRGEQEAGQGVLQLTYQDLQE